MARVSFVAHPRSFKSITSTRVQKSATTSGLGPSLDAKPSLISVRFYVPPVISRKRAGRTDALSRTAPTVPIQRGNVAARSVAKPTALPKRRGERSNAPKVSLLLELGWPTALEAANPVIHSHVARPLRVRSPYSVLSSVIPFFPCGTIEFKIRTRCSDLPEREVWWAERESNPHSLATTDLQSAELANVQPTHSRFRIRSLLNFGCGAGTRTPMTSVKNWRPAVRRLRIGSCPRGPLSRRDGRGTGSRTLNLRFWRPVLYQLSYTPSATRMRLLAEGAPIMLHKHRGTQLGSGTGRLGDVGVCSLHGVFLLAAFRLVPHWY